MGGHPIFKTKIDTVIMLCSLAFRIIFAFYQSDSFIKDMITSFTCAFILCTNAAQFDTQYQRIAAAPTFVNRLVQIWAELWPQPNKSACYKTMSPE